MRIITQRGQRTLQDRPLVVGLVNNMKHSAMASARAQFARLLNTAGRSTELICFTMRTAQDGLHDHLPIDAITDRAIDAVIVTGMEVTTADLRDEWIWHRFTRLYDWCEQESVPVIWSCLAAHAAVLYRDGIARRPTGEKLSGVFDCQRASSPHKLMHGLPARWCCPHSRYNGLPGEALAARGYALLSQGEAVGVDIFMRKDKPTSFYFQGHPEYQPETLLQEFLRDLRRYLSGDSQLCPSVPSTYLNLPAEQEFLALRQQALAGHNVMAIARTLRADFRRSWAGVAAQLFANWLDIVAEHTTSDKDWTALADAEPKAGAVVP